MPERTASMADAEVVYLSTQDLIEALAAPTPDHQIGFLPNSVRAEIGQKVGTALAIPFVSWDFCLERLNQVLGPFGWKEESREAAGNLIKVISILHPATNEWIPHEGVGSSEAEESGLNEESRAFKRACVKWGIGVDVRALRRLRKPCDVKWLGGRGQAHNPRPVFKKWADNHAQMLAAARLGVSHQEPRRESLMPPYPGVRDTTTVYWAAVNKGGHTEISKEIVAALKFDGNGERWDTNAGLWLLDLYVTDRGLFNTLMRLPSGVLRSDPEGAFEQLAGQRSGGPYQPKAFSESE